MNLLYFLQLNAEWMCAIAIAFFAAVQCYLAYQKNIQDVKIKRLELANELDEVCSTCTIYDKNESKTILQWLQSRASKFIFLLNKKDRECYKELCLLLYQYDFYPVKSEEERLQIIKKCYALLGELNMALGNANYGFQKDNKEFKSTVKNA